MLPHGRVVWITNLSIPEALSLTPCTFPYLHFLLLLWISCLAFPICIILFYIYVMNNFYFTLLQNFMVSYCYSVLFLRLIHADTFSITSLISNARYIHYYSNPLTKWIVLYTCLILKADFSCLLIIQFRKKINILIYDSLRTFGISLGHTLRSEIAGTELLQHCCLITFQSDCYHLCQYFKMVSFFYTNGYDLYRIMVYLVISLITNNTEYLLLKSSTNRFSFVWTVHFLIWLGFFPLMICFFSLILHSNILSATCIPNSFCHAMALSFLLYLWYHLLHQGL